MPTADLRNLQKVKRKSNVDGVEEKSGRGTHDLAAWSATVMSNMLLFLSSGMVRECGYPQARHCA